MIDSLFKYDKFKMPFVTITDLYNISVINNTHNIW